MAETPRATQEGVTGQPPSTPSQPAVAGAGEPTAPETTLDLSTLPQFREYDAKMQKRIADMERKSQEAETRQKEATDLARREAVVSATRSKLQAEGLDEKAINETITPIQEDNVRLRFQIMRRDLADEFKFSLDELSPEDWGSSPEQGRANLARKRALKDLEDIKKETERVKAEGERVRHETEKQGRRETGADKVASVGAAPPADETQALLEQMRKEVTAASGHEKLTIRNVYRRNHPELAPYL